MLYVIKQVWLRLAVPSLVITIATASAHVHAHVHWTQVNSVGPDTAALYHFDTNSSTEATPAGGLQADLALSRFSGAESLAPDTDSPGTIFNPYSLALPATQTLRSTSTLSQVQGDLTIECWFKWNPAMTTCSLQIGLQSGAKILVSRDIAVPSNDRFGIAGTHGSVIAATGFTSWADIGDEEAGLDQWRHLALAIHSTGIHYDSPSAHDVYSTGTVGRIYLNGHPVGAFPHTIDLSGLKVHDTSRVTVMIAGGGMSIDEFTIWRRDWSDNGSTANPFANGRGVPSAVNAWNLYDD